MAHAETTFYNGRSRFHWFFCLVALCAFAIVLCAIVGAVWMVVWLFRFFGIAGALFFLI